MFLFPSRDALSRAVIFGSFLSSWLFYFQTRVSLRWLRFAIRRRVADFVRRFPKPTSSVARVFRRSVEKYVSRPFEISISNAARAAAGDPSNARKTGNVSFIQRSLMVRGGKIGLSAERLFIRTLCKLLRARETLIAWKDIERSCLVWGLFFF